MSTLAVLALAVLCQEVVQDVRAPGPPRPIAGMRGFFATTTVVFEEQLDEPHKLHAAYLFPDRARFRSPAAGRTALARSSRPMGTSASTLLDV